MSLVNPASLKAIGNMMTNFMPFAKERFGYEEQPSVRFAKDPDNSADPLGKTGYYEPQHKRVTVYIDGRHPKDIMRSLSHELVHHAQNSRGDLEGSQGVGEQGYAQNDEHLREMEREAYEQGNLCFRDWEDGVKSENPSMYESLNKTGAKARLLESQFAPSAAEEAAKINKDLGGDGYQFSEDPAYWEKHGIRTGEELAVSLIYQTYSDVYKSIFNIRPRWVTFRNADEAQKALDELDGQVEGALAQQKIDAEAEAEWLKAKAEIEELMPNMIDIKYGGLPKQSGHGRGLRENMFTKRNRSLNKRLMESFGYNAEEGESADQLPEWVHYYIEGQLESEGWKGSLPSIDYTQIAEEWSQFSDVATKVLQDTLGINGEDAYLSEDPELYLLFHTLIESGRSFHDGDLDHMNLDLEQLEAEIKTDLQRFADPTGGGSLNDAIRDTMTADAEGGDKEHEVYQEGDVHAEGESKKDFVAQAWEKAGATSRTVSDEESGSVESFNNWLAADHQRQQDWEPAQSYRGGRVLAYNRNDQKYYDVQNDMYVDDSEMDQILPEVLKFKLQTKLQEVFLKYPELARNKEFIKNIKKGVSAKIMENNIMRKNNEANEGGEGVHDVFNLPPEGSAEGLPPGAAVRTADSAESQKEAGLRQIVAQHQAAKVDGVMVDAFTASAIVQIIDGLKPEIRVRFLAEPVQIMAQMAMKMMNENIRRGQDALGENYQDKYTSKEDWMQKFQQAAGSPQPIPQDFWATAMHRYNQGDDPYEAGDMYAARSKADYKEPEDPMDDFNYAGSRHHYQEGKIYEFGDHETQAQDGMVSSNHSSDPELDQVADIVRTAVERGLGLHDFKQALEAESFDVQATSQYVMIKTSYGTIAIASANNVELDGSEELIQAPGGSSYAVGYIEKNNQMESRKSKINKEVQRILKEKDTMKVGVKEGVQDRLDAASDDSDDLASDNGDDAPQGNVQDRAKDDGKKGDVINLVKVMFKSPQTAPALEKVKRDPNKVAEFIGILAAELGLEAEGLKSLQSRIAQKMTETDLGDQVAKGLKENFDDDMFDSYDDDEYGEPSQEDEEIEALLRQYGLNKSDKGGSREEVPADVQRQMDDELGSVEDEEEEDPARRAYEGKLPPALAKYQAGQGAASSDDDEDPELQADSDAEDEDSEKETVKEFLDPGHTNKRNNMLNETLMNWATK